MRWELTCGSEITAAAEVPTPTWDRPGGTPRGADAEVMDRADSWALDIATITVASRVTVDEATADRTEGRTEATEGTGIRMGVKITHPSLPISNTYIGRSAETMPTVTEVGRADHQRRGEEDLVHMVNSGVKK